MFSFRKATHRSTPAYIVEVGRTTYFISYETVVAVRIIDPVHGVVLARRDNVWGPTTGRHMREMGVYDWPVSDDAVMRAVLGRDVTAVIDALQDLNTPT